MSKQKKSVPSQEELLKSHVQVERFEQSINGLLGNILTIVDAIVTSDKEDGQKIEVVHDVQFSTQQATSSGGVRWETKGTPTQKQAIKSLVRNEFSRFRTDLAK